ncbi:hypothetical protein F2Q70_00008892, partial [Brassica cretica]
FSPKTWRRLSRTVVILSFRIVAMACLRGISKRVNLLQRRVYPTCGHLISDDKDQTKPSSDTMIRKVFAFNGANTLTSMFMERQCAGPLGLGLSSCRFMSSTTTPPEWSDKVDGIDFVAPEVVPDQIVEAVTTTSQAVVPAVNEVAIAAADSAFPVAALQHLIDGVHSFTGLNWYSNMQEGMEGNPVAGTMKKFSRIIAFLSIPILMGIEKALFCYWLTSNLFTLGRPDVRKLLNLPDAVTSSSTGQPKPPSPMPFSFEQPKDQSVVGHEDPPMSSSEDPSVSSPESSSSVPERRISRSSVLNQRIRTLERQLKDQKKKK